MAEGGDDSEKTEEPTHRRLEDAHEKGDVVRSLEVSALFTLTAVTVIVVVTASPVSRMLVDPLRGLIEHSGELATDSGGLRRLLLAIGGAVGIAIAAPLAIMAVAAVAGHLVQHKMVWTAEKLKPELSKISPLAGAKRLVSAESLANFVKGLVKIAIVSGAMIYVIWPRHEEFAGLLSLDVAGILAISHDMAGEMLFAMLAAMAVVAGLDYFWVRHRWMQRQRMSLKEVKDEMKHTEGDPQIKSKIRQIRMERSRKRMMAAVPTATVVITNPTHYAVALKYDSSMQAPVCVAKGIDEVALRIRDLAREHKVEVVENPPLARALFAAVEIDQMIPEGQYRAVAEVIGYVMNGRRAASWRN